MTGYTTNYHATAALLRARMPFRLAYVYRPIQSEVVSFRALPPQRIVDEDSALATMIASEALLAEDWDSPEDDEAWADL